MYRKYKAIFFDWDGTAVLNRTAPTDRIVAKMIPLLQSGVKLFIISGTTFENIAGGHLHENIPKGLLHNLYLGLGRGAYCDGFNAIGERIHLHSVILNTEERLKLDKAAFDLHCRLYQAYGLQTDIIFSRPNYCKIDLMVENDRGNQLFLQTSEVEKVKGILNAHGLPEGLSQLLEAAEEIGRDYGMKLSATTDAKYLEIGVTTKSDNVDFFMEKIVLPTGIETRECCFWGDEFRYLDDGVCGSDTLMLTEKTRDGDFFDVSDEAENLPPKVSHVGGSVERFMSFLEEQADFY